MKDLQGPHIWAEKYSPTSSAFLRSSRLDKYYSEMPKSALDFSQRDFKDLLSYNFEGDGIPHLVLIYLSTGLINRDGRTTIESYGAEYYPWTEELLKKAKDEK